MQVVGATNSTLSAGETVTADWRVVSPTFFQAMSVPLRRGRFFNERDVENGPPTMIISEQLAHRLWPSADPVGQQLKLENGVSFHIAGVAGDMLQRNLAEPARPAVYFSSTQAMWDTMGIVVRTTGDPMAMQGVLRAKLKEIDPSLPLANVRPLDHWLSNSTARPKFQSTLLSVFSGLALLLAGIGIYGVISYSVAQRTAEIGIRVALGAVKADVLRMILTQGLKLVAGGVAAGIVGAFLLGSAISSMLYGIQPRDAATLILVPLALALIAVIACLLPAIRAARVDPIKALRCE
jgi:putative ABC transport system permease protein